MLSSFRSVMFAAVVLSLNLARCPVTRGADPNVITNSIGMKLVKIPAGEFMMGSEESRTSTLEKYPYCEPTSLDGELPRHRVRITRPFYMGKYEVTLREYHKYANDMRYKADEFRTGIPSWAQENSQFTGSSRFQPSELLDHPVVFATWNEAEGFCNWLSKKEGKNYRLPTEAEWEYACRAGSKHRYSFGDDPEQLVQFGNGTAADSKSHWPTSEVLATFDTNGNKTAHFISFPFLSQPDGYPLTAPVGKFRPNAFGLHDMHGNAAEMCSDWYDPDYYKNSPVNNPTGPSGGSSRVLRGGGCGTSPVTMRCAYRFAYWHAHRHKVGGFRVVRDL